MNSCRQMKYLILIAVFLLSISVVSAGDNITTIDNPTEHVENANMTTALESGDSNISFSDGYKGYCIEWGEHSAEQGEKFYIHDEVDNNLKVFFTYFYEDSQKDVIATQHMIWKFTDNKEFSRFNKTLYDQIINVSKTVQVPNQGTMKIDNTTEMVFDFKTFVSQYEEYQNYFGYKIFFRNISDAQNNESLSNQTTNSSTNIQNNQSSNQIDNTTIKNNTADAIKYTLPDNKKTLLSKHKTGSNIWIILLSLFFIIRYRRN